MRAVGRGPMSPTTIFRDCPGPDFAAGRALHLICPLKRAVGKLPTLEFFVPPKPSRRQSSQLKKMATTDSVSVFAEGTFEDQVRVFFSFLFVYVGGLTSDHDRMFSRSENWWITLREVSLRMTARNLSARFLNSSRLRHLWRVKRPKHHLRSHKKIKSRFYLSSFQRSRD